VARYEIVDIETGVVMSWHRTRPAALNAWRIRHVGASVGIDRVYRDGERRRLVEGRWRFADDVPDSSPAALPGPTPIPDLVLLDALRRVADQVDRPLSSASYHALRSPTDPGARTIGARFGGWDSALKAAGLAPTEFTLRRHGDDRRRRSDGELLDAVAAWAATATDTRLPSYAKAASADRALPSPDLLARRFGGWRRVLSALADRT
jgi:hypothetical protein